MKHQVIGLEIWDKLLIIRNLSFCDPYFLELDQILKKFFCVLSQPRVHKLPLPVARTSLRFLCVTFTLWDHKRDLLVIKAVHVEGVFTLCLRNILLITSRKL